MDSSGIPIGTTPDRVVNKANVFGKVVFRHPDRDYTGSGS
jgi:hypothetical protein